jgi:hypothetical protein
MLKLFSFFFRVGLTLAVAHWIYAEALLFAPTLQSPIERACNSLRIPTHDQWNPEFKDNPIAYLNTVLPDSKIFKQ